MKNNALNLVQFLKCMAIFQCDRAKLAKEKQLKEEALREKAELERKLSQMQEEVRTAQEMLVSDKEKKF